MGSLERAAEDVYLAQCKISTTHVFASSEGGMAAVENLSTSMRERLKDLNIFSHEVVSGCALTLAIVEFLIGLGHHPNNAIGLIGSTLYDMRDSINLEQQIKSLSAE